MLLVSLMQKRMGWEGEKDEEKRDSDEGRVNKDVDGEEEESKGQRGGEGGCR